MGVLKVIPIIGRSGGVDRQRAHEFEEPYHVIVTPGTSPVEVLAHPEVPKPFSSHPDFPLALAGRPFVDQENRRLYRLDVPYSTTQAPGEREANFIQNPLNRRTIIDVRATTVRELIETDWEGNPLVNTAGDLLVGIEEDEALWEISVQKNVPPSLPAWFEDYANAINKDPVRVRGKILKKHQLKMAGIDIPDSQFENGIEFIPLSARAVYRKKGWRRQFLNYGLRERKPVLGELTGKQVGSYVGPILIDGEPITERIPLDENGQAFREKIQITESDVIYKVKTQVDRADIENNKLTYDTKPVLPFRRLGLFV